MELEELKEVWTSIDERLKKEEILKENIIREMLSSKTDKSIKRLLWTDCLGIPIILALIPFLVWAYEKYGGKLLFWDSTIIFVGAFCIIYLPFLVYRVYGLMKMDISGNIKDNLYHISHYKIQIKREKYSMFFFTPLLFILMGLHFIETKVNAFGWSLWICMIIFVCLYYYWAYNKFYSKKIQSIQKNLEELKELEKLEK